MTGCDRSAKGSETSGRDSVYTPIEISARDKKNESMSLIHRLQF